MEEKKIVIKANKAGIEAIKTLCDIALKVGGIQNLDGVALVLSSVEKLSKKKKKTKDG